MNLADAVRWLNVCNHNGSADWWTSRGRVRAGRRLGSPILTEFEAIAVAEKYEREVVEDEPEPVFYGEPGVLTDRQNEFFGCICRFHDKHGYPPTIRDLCEMTEISSPNGAICHLKALQKKGFIARSMKKGRGIKILRR